MQKYLFTLILVTSEILIAQTNTEVYISDIDISAESFTISEPQNVSKNIGYDNQPSFYDSETLLFAGTQGKDTDIAISGATSLSPEFLFLDTEGGEYSPQRIPGSQEVAAVRLDPDGKQRLYSYKKKPSSDVRILLDELQVAYYAFANSETLLASVLAGNQLDLVVANLKTQKLDTILEGSGRSIHKVPGTDAMSYTAINEEGNWDIYQLDMESLESFFVCQLPIGIQDHIWLDDSRLLLGSGDKLFLYDLFGNGEWKMVADLPDYNLNEITRLAVSPNGKKLAFAAETIGKDPETVVDVQLEAYNNRDIDAFMATYSDDIKLYNFPDTLISEGKEAMKKMYGSFFKNTPDLNCEIKNRIMYDNKVIDEEYLTINGRNLSAIAIYEVNDGLITKVTFIQ